MAKRAIILSDISGDEVLDTDAATVRVTLNDAERTTYVLDVTADEAREIGAKGRKVGRQGRKPVAAEVKASK